MWSVREKVKGDFTSGWMGKMSWAWGLVIGGDAMESPSEDVQ